MLRAISDSNRIYVSRPYSCSRDYLLIDPLHSLGHLAQSGKLETPRSFYIIVSWFSLDSPSAAQQLKRSSNRALNCGSQLPIENCHRLSQPAQSGSFNRAAPVILHNSLWAESRQLECSCKLKHLSSFELQSTSSIAPMEVHYSSIHEGLQLISGPLEKAVLYVLVYVFVCLFVCVFVCLHICVYVFVCVFVCVSTTAVYVLVRMCTRCVSA